MTQNILYPYLSVACAKGIHGTKQITTLFIYIIFTSITNFFEGKVCMKTKDLKIKIKKYEK